MTTLLQVALAKERGIFVVEKKDIQFEQLGISEQSGPLTENLRVGL